MLKMIVKQKEKSAIMENQANKLFTGLILPVNFSLKSDKYCH